MEKENQPKNAKELGELHPNEVELIWRIRNDYQYGRVEIETRAGLPVHILRTIERQALGQ